VAALALEVGGAATDHKPGISNEVAGVSGSGNTYWESIPVSAPTALSKGCFRRRSVAVEATPCSCHPSRVWALRVKEMPKNNNINNTSVCATRNVRLTGFPQ
jgi:hypothetical protein